MQTLAGSRKTKHPSTRSFESAAKQKPKTRKCLHGKCGECPLQSVKTARKPPDYFKCALHRLRDLTNCWLKWHAISKCALGSLFSNSPATLSSCSCWQELPGICLLKRGTNNNTNSDCVLQSVPSADCRLWAGSLSLCQFTVSRVEEGKVAQ